MVAASIARSALSSSVRQLRAPVWAAMRNNASYLRNPNLCLRSTYQFTSYRGYAQSTEQPPSATDPTDQNIQELFDQGNVKLESGDLEGALAAYQASVNMKETPTGLYNMGVCHYQLGQHEKSIQVWERSLKLSEDLASKSNDPDSILQGTSDIRMNLASAYIMSKPPQVSNAIANLRKAVELSPTDAEIRFNFAVVLESAGLLQDALTEYKAAQNMGIERAEQNVRNVGAKLLRQKLDQEEQEKKNNQ